MEWANPAEKRACENSSTVQNRQLTGSSWRSPHPESQLQGLQFPHWGSSRLEDGLSNLSWETRGYELYPLRNDTHSFHNSEQGWKIMPAAGERRSLLMGIPHAEPSRREIRSKNYTWPGQNGVLAIDGPHTRSRAIGGKAYRQSLSHVCTIASSPSGAGWVRENQRGQCDVWRVANRFTCAWPKTLQICFTTSGWSLYSPGLCLDRMSAPILRCPGI